MTTGAYVGRRRAHVAGGIGRARKCRSEERQDDNKEGEKDQCRCAESLQCVPPWRELGRTGSDEGAPHDAQDRITQSLGGLLLV